MSGRSNSASQYWLLERFVALAILPFSIWFLACAVRYASADRGAVAAWIGDPITGIAVVIMVVLSLCHMVLGLSVIIDDYVHSSANFWIKLIVKLTGVSLGIMGSVSVIIIATSG